MRLCWNERTFRANRKGDAPGSLTETRLLAEQDLGGTDLNPFGLRDDAFELRSKGKVCRDETSPKHRRTRSKHFRLGVRQFLRRRPNSLV
jgi:hypothetical protein